jgi:hypothetical protein
MTNRTVPPAPAKRSSSRPFGWVFGLVCACGPSLKTVHEGTVRFEHCNRLDLDQRVTKNECSQCWKSWLAEYTYGQPRDRIDYARRRSVALANGDEGARPVLKVDDQSSEARQFYLVVPGPTSVRAPPPPVATVWKDADAGALAKTSEVGPPAESCADDCRSTWQTCSSGCTNGHGTSGAGRGNGSNHVAAGGSGNAASKGSGGKSSGATPGTPPSGTNGCTRCRTDYSSCMKSCFE